jgi:hypothetical protein
MNIYKNIKTGKILKMSESAYNILGKNDHLNIIPYELPKVEKPNVLKEIEAQKTIIEPKKRGRNAKVQVK